MWTLLTPLLLLSVPLEADGLVYKAVGGTAVLTPDKVDQPIGNILWKQGPDLAADWSGGEVTLYRHFKGISKVDRSTGALTITRLTPEHSGVYVAEINFQSLPNSFQLQVISPVSKPNISKQCDAEMTFCNLTCEGHTAGAEPVTYRWRLPDRFVNSTQVLTIERDETERSCSCILENPVSSEESAALTVTFPQTRNMVGMILAFLLAAIAVIVVIVLKRKLKSNKEFDLLNPGKDTWSLCATTGSSYLSVPQVLIDLNKIDQETTNHETTNHETTNQETTNHETTNHYATNHYATNHETFDHETTNQETSDHETSDHEITNPETTTNQETTNQEQTNHETTNQEKTNHETTNQEQTNHETANQEQTNHETANQEQTNHETANQEQTNHETANQDQTNQETTNQETTNHKTTNQETTNQEQTNQETTDRETTDFKSF